MDQALKTYGSLKPVRAISEHYVASVVTMGQEIGLTWERYPGDDEDHALPIERVSARPLHVFSSASGVVGQIASS